MYGSAYLHHAANKKQDLSVFKPVRVAPQQSWVYYVIFGVAGVRQLHTKITNRSDMMLDKQPNTTQCLHPQNGQTTLGWDVCIWYCSIRSIRIFRWDLRCIIPRGCHSHHRFLGHKLLQHIANRFGTKCDVSVKSPCAMSCMYTKYFQANTDGTERERERVVQLYLSFLSLPP